MVKWNSGLWAHWLFLTLLEIKSQSECICIDSETRKNKISRKSQDHDGVIHWARHDQEVRTSLPFSKLDPKAKPKTYRYPAFYDPYGPKPPPSDKIILLAECIAGLPPEELKQIGPTLRDKLRHPKMQEISSEGMDLGPQGGAAGSTKVEEKAEKTAFDVKLEKFDTAAKIKVIKEVRAFTNLGLKEAKDLVEKAPVLLKGGVTKEEANDIIEKLKAAGGVAVME
ncbi:hypothetical protein NE237_000898 [Protea cynaroides]|uniref:Large ribosomal subunit protein bL12 C-terminal domain-containing protein n=1 Tax=Protea cynaroides TaxID=273540 RepID=A0A9Q0QXX0_9MAGN|nr:hypothetical protein NE237_000898 [Protea cynaroides]